MNHDARIESLERSMRRMKAGMLGLTAVAAMGWVLGAQQLKVLDVDEITARKITVADHVSSAVVTPGRVLLRGDGKASASISVHSNAGYMNLASADASLSLRTVGTVARIDGKGTAYGDAKVGFSLAAVKPNLELWSEAPARRSVTELHHMAFRDGARLSSTDGDQKRPVKIENPQ